MRRHRFVQPETVRLELSDGDWIEAKARLSYAAESAIMNAAFKSVRNPESGETVLDMDISRAFVTRIHTWVVDWSFVDEFDKRVPVTRTAIEQLDRETVEEINEALNQHIAALEAAKKGSRPAPSGSSTANGSTPRSSSVAGLAGPTPTFATAQPSGSRESSS